MATDGSSPPENQRDSPLPLVPSSDTNRPLPARYRPRPRSWTTGYNVEKPLFLSDVDIQTSINTRLNRSSISRADSLKLPRRSNADNDSSRGSKEHWSRIPGGDHPQRQTSTRSNVDLGQWTPQAASNIAKNRPSRDWKPQATHSPAHASGLHAYHDQLPPQHRPMVPNVHLFRQTDPWYLLPSQNPDFYRDRTLVQNVRVPSLHNSRARPVPPLRPIRWKTGSDDLKRGLPSLRNENNEVVSNKRETMRATNSMKLNASTSQGTESLGRHSRSVSNESRPDVLSMFPTFGMGLSTSPPKEDFESMITKKSYSFPSGDLDHDEYPELVSEKDSDTNSIHNEPTPGQPSDYIADDAVYSIRAIGYESPRPYKTGSASSKWKDVISFPKKTISKPVKPADRMTKRVRFASPKEFSYYEPLSQSCLYSPTAADASSNRISQLELDMRNFRFPTINSPDEVAAMPPHPATQPPAPATPNTPIRGHKREVRTDSSRSFSSFSIGGTNQFKFASERAGEKPATGDAFSPTLTRDTATGLHQFPSPESFDSTNIARGKFGHEKRS